MPYSDPEKQKEAVRAAVQRHRGITETHVIPDPCNTLDVIPEAKVLHEDVVDVIPDDGCLYSFGHKYRGPIKPVVLTDDMKARLRVLEVQGGAWAKVAKNITTPCPDMPNLERLQRIAGSLGKYADMVFYGQDGLTMADIGKVIGTLPPVYGK